MDQNPVEGVQTANILPVADKSCSQSFSPIKKPYIQEMPHFDANLVSPTPEKTEETVNVRCKKEPAKLTEKYKLLLEFFDRMTTSLRLLNLRKQLPVFQNICCLVETLTGRKFSYRNLAQIKFILPEAVQTDKILLHSKKTLCMEPDIKVTLIFDVIKDHTEHSDYIALSRVFSNRLFKFMNTHSEDYDVPEAELPEPFNRKEIKVSANSLPIYSSIQTLPNLDETELLNPSHLPPSFKRHFSKKEIEKPTKTNLSKFPISPSFAKETGFSSYLDSVKQEEALKVDNGNTPMKNQLPIDDISIETPDLSTPKRSVATEDNKLKSMVNQKIIASSLLAKRSLDFLNFDEDLFFEEKITSDSSPAKVEDKAYQLTSNYLSGIVEIILNIFQSANCYSITRSELVHKILMNNLDITESGEIEEQIELLVKKVPEWISKKEDPFSGDFLFNINKGLDLKSITEKLM